MKSYTEYEIGFPLDKWIDTKTGELNGYEDMLLRMLSANVDDIISIVPGNLPYANRYYNGLPGLEIKLSKHVLYKTRPGLSLDAIKKMLDNVMQDYSDERLLELKYLLEKINNIKELRQDRAIADYIKRFRTNIERIRELLDEIEKKQTLTLGTFTSSTDKNKLGTITLYTKAIAISQDAYVSGFNTVFWAVFAHELFHAYHYSLFKEKGVQGAWNSGSTEKNRDIVKESLADSFEYIFLINYAGDGLDSNAARQLRDSLEDTWRRYDVIDWPYSGALCIGGVGLTKIAVPPDLMNKLLEMSICDWKTSAEIIKTTYYLDNTEVKKILKWML